MCGAHFTCKASLLSPRGKLTLPYIRLAICVSYGNDYSPRPNLTPNEVTHLTLALALTLHTNMQDFTFVNYELRNFSSDKVTPNILIINDFACHLSLVTCTITHRVEPTQYTVPLQSWLFLHVLEVPLQCLEG